jgi:hypothetical protein
LGGSSLEDADEHGCDGGEEVEAVFIHRGGVDIDVDVVGVAM